MSRSAIRFRNNSRRTVSVLISWRDVRKAQPCGRPGRTGWHSDDHRPHQSDLAKTRRLDERDDHGSRRHSPPRIGDRHDPVPPRAGRFPGKADSRLHREEPRSVLLFPPQPSSQPCPHTSRGRERCRQPAKSRMPRWPCAFYQRSSTLIILVQSKSPAGPARSLRLLT